jgi:hypothetical protein
MALNYYARLPHLLPAVNDPNDREQFLPALLYNFFRKISRPLQTISTARHFGGRFNH